ncbi:MAG TPA: oligosaccharide flippase family protein [Opitutaceae bacterium]|jgi:O-antigen/teichoic acid export membrane protein
MDVMPIRSFAGLSQLVKDRIGSYGVRGAEMMIWRVVGLAASAVGSIWAARCLGPENLGISGVVMSVVALVTLVVTLGLDNACIRTVKGALDDANVEEFVRTIVSVRTLVALAFVIICGVAVAAAIWAGTIHSSWWLAIAAAFPLIYLQGNSALWLLQAKELQLIQYRLIAGQSVFMAAVYLAFLRPGAPAGSDILVQAIALTGMFCFAWRFATGLNLKGVLKVSITSARAGFRYANNERWAVAITFVVYFYTAFSLPLIGLRSTVPEAGRFRAAANLSQSVAAVLLIYTTIIYPRVLAWHQEAPEELFDRQIQAARLLLPWLIVTLICAAIGAPLLIPVVLGKQYLGSVWPFVVLVGAKLVLTLSSVFVAGVRAHRRDRMLCLCLIGVMLCSIGLNWIILPYYGALGAACVSMFSECVVLVMCVCFCLQSVES